MPAVWPVQLCHQSHIKLFHQLVLPGLFFVTANEIQICLYWHLLILLVAYYYSWFQKD